MSQFIQTHWTSSGNNWSSVTNHTSHSIIKKTISHGDTSGHAATNQPWSPRGPRGRGGAQTRTPLILVTHKHGNRQCWATPAAGNEVWLFIYCCEVNSRGRVAPKTASVGYVSCEELHSLSERDSLEGEFYHLASRMGAGRGQLDHATPWIPRARGAWQRSHGF